MRVYEASTRISAEFGGIRDLSRHLSLNCICSRVPSVRRVDPSRGDVPAVGVRRQQRRQVPDVPSDQPAHAHGSRVGQPQARRALWVERHCGWRGTVKEMVLW